MALAIVVSYMIHRTKGFGATLLDFLCVVPIGFPGIVLAMGVLVTYIKTPIYATLWILLLGYITRFFPYGQRNVSSIMLAISEDLDQSSRMAGATESLMPRSRSIRRRNESRSANSPRLPLTGRP